MRYLDNKGDTIIEVLLALAVVSSVLAGAFVSSNRSLVNSYQTQERSEAVKYVETQLERLKATVASSTNIFTTANYCFDATGGVLTPLGKAPAATASGDDFTTAEYPAVCNFGSIPGGYHLSIVQTSPVFTVRARWESANRNGRDEVKITYKVNP